MKACVQTNGEGNGNPLQYCCLEHPIDRGAWQTTDNGVIRVTKHSTSKQKRASRPSSNDTRDESTHGHHQMVNTEIRLIIFFADTDGEALYSQHKQDQELTVAQIMNSLLPNSYFN